MSIQVRAILPVAVLCLWMCSLSAGAEDSWLCPWRMPVPVVELNTGYHDKAPFLSFDGLTLVFSRDDAPGSNYSRIYEARRSTVSEPFAEATEVSSLNYPGGHVSGPWLSPDNLRLYYYVTGGPGRRLKVTQRDSQDEPWGPGRDISELNEWGDLASPTLTEDERIMVFAGYSVLGGRGEWDLWMADRADRDSPFGNIVNLDSLNTSATDVHPSISPDGLTLYFMSKRNGASQIFRAHRDSLDAPFDAVEHMTMLDTPNGNSEFPSVSADGTTLYFGRWPNGEDMDICVSHSRNVYHVDGVHGRNSWDGLSSQTAFRTIQKAINKAVDGDVVNVYPGVYQEETRFLGKAITVRSIADAAIIEAPDGLGVSFYMGEGPDTVLRNVVIANSYVGILCTHSSPTIANVTVVGNVLGVEAYGDSDPDIRNSIFWSNAESDLYGCQATYSCIERGGEGEGDFSDDPLFVDAERGDYHVRSERGRYWPKHDVWVLDDVSSPCIDAGDRAGDFSREPMPNGARLNVGAHGGTAFAERSETPFDVDVNDDGLVDESDLDLFLDLWEQQVQPESPTVVRR
ncbi:MAG: hypothetical protein ABFE13_20775 [Phycisphaerales bacterium]